MNSFALFYTFIKSIIASRERAFLPVIVAEIMQQYWYIQDEMPTVYLKLLQPVHGALFVNTSLAVTCFVSDELLN